MVKLDMVRIMVKPDMVMIMHGEAGHGHGDQDNKSIVILIQLAVAVQPGVDPNSGQWPADGECHDHNHYHKQ